MSSSTAWDQRKLAEHWQVSESTLERWRSEGIGPIFLKIRGSVRYRLSDIQRWLDSRTRNGTTPA